MAYEKPRIIDVTGRAITIAHFEVPKTPITYLLSDIAAAATSLTVVDNLGFANTNLLLIGELGAGQTEIKKVNAAVTTGTALTTTAVTFAHSAGTPIRKILFDQWRIYGNSTNTSTGATLIATVDMQVDGKYTTYVNTSTEYSFYLVLPYDSINVVAGDTYSDGVSNSTAYAPNTVGSMINKALDASKSERGDIITDRWMIGEINDCLRFITGKLKRWSFLQNYNYVLGQTSRGGYVFTLPTDIEDANSIKSILDVRVGGDQGLIYRDKKEFERETENLILTTVRTQATSGATSLNITNSYDYADSGSVKVYISGTQYSITYTGVTRSATAGILTGVPASGTGSISVTIPVDTNVLQDEQEGKPKYFSVWDGSLYIYPFPDSSNDNQNVYLDYSTIRTLVDSSGDSMEGSRFDACKHWLTWKLRSQDNASGKLDMDDGDYKMFKEILGDLIRTEISGQRYKMKPRYNSISYGSKRPPQVVT